MKKENDSGYELLDSGNGRKLERFGSYVFSRPAAQAVWRPSLPEPAWNAADASFAREGGNAWSFRGALPPSWNIAIDGMSFKLAVTDFGHLGVFPEQRGCWKMVAAAVAARARDKGGPPRVLNLFAYSGGATLAAARAGAAVSHLDASKGMTARARENAELNGIRDRPVKWIVEDVSKFLGREIRRGNRYDGIILDPPSFGRGKTGEVYKIERDLPATVADCASLLSDKPMFVLLSCHTPLLTPMALGNVLGQCAGKGRGSIEAGEMALAGGPGVMPLPSGSFAFWKAP